MRPIEDGIDKGQQALEVEGLVNAAERAGIFRIDGAAMARDDDRRNAKVVFEGGNGVEAV